MSVIVEPYSQNELKVVFKYNSDLLSRVKQIEGRRWGREGKYWTVPYSENMIEKLRSTFEGYLVIIDPRVEHTDLAHISQKAVSDREKWVVAVRDSSSTARIQF